MKKNRPYILITLISMIILAVALFLRPMGSQSDVLAFLGITDNEDSKLIRETIIRSYKIENEAAMTFDNSKFPSVFIDDARGADLSSSQLKFVQNVTQQHLQTDFGYLTYKQTYFAWWSKGAIAMEELMAKANQEEHSITKEEVQDLIGSNSGLMPPARAEAVEEDPEIRFISLVIDGDQSVVTFDDGPRTNEMTLVKINGDWLIAGNRILALHP
jgi:hypothetical protein